MKVIDPRGNEVMKIHNLGGFRHHGDHEPDFPVQAR